MTRFRRFLSRLAGRFRNSPLDEGRYQKQPDLALSLCTPFGLQVDVRKSTDDNNSSSHGTITLSTQVTIDDKYKRNDYEQVPPWHYRLSPEVSTSGLWYKKATPEGNVELDEDTIRERHPTLAPFFEMWHDIYQDSMVDQDMHLGVNVPLFPDMQTRVAWDVAGYLVACCIAMQDKVAAIEYTFKGGIKGKQLITRENMAVAIVEFLEFEMALLGGAAGRTFTSRL